MKCPKCGFKTPTPTPRQQEAYRLVHIHGCSQEEASLMMDMSQPAVSKLLKRLRATRPDLFAPMPRITHSKVLSYEDTMSYSVVKQF